ncbi:MAG TPA: hypothetical protein PLD22_03285 [Bacillota bacterium]|nr:hypothetical protein [Bacillota bacterium]HPZ58985.1 hypothetical protein [Bacillota bacterium]HQC82333.1 hypothetical protein [Bacillota bacterium]
MPVLENPVSTRLEILRTLYTLSDKRPGKIVKFYAAQINGGYYSEINYQMRFLQERGLLEYSRNIISKQFSAALTESGIAFMEDAYQALKSDETEREARLEEIFARIKA